MEQHEKQLPLQYQILGINLTEEQVNGLIMSALINRNAPTGRPHRRLLNALQSNEVNQSILTAYAQHLAARNYNIFYVLNGSKNDLISFGSGIMELSSQSRVAALFN